MPIRHVDKIFVCHHPELTERKQYLVKKLEEMGIEAQWIEGFPPNESHFGEVGPRSISLFKKFLECCRLTVENNYQNVIIFEDDIEILSNLVDILNGCMDEFVAEKAEMLFLGTCCDLHVSPVDNSKLIHYRPNLTTRCTHAMVLTLETVKKILSNKLMYFFDKPIDHKLNDVILDLKLRNYWYEPGISQTRMWKSSLDEDRVGTIWQG